MSSNQDKIYSLAESIKDCLSRDSEVTPLDTEELANKIQKYLDMTKLQLVSLTEQPSQAKVSVLLKPSPNAKRMRELAGIPGKGNFV